LGYNFVVLAYINVLRVVHSNLKLATQIAHILCYLVVFVKKKVNKRNKELYGKIKKLNYNREVNEE
jgi:hypothetical protein